MRKRWQREGYQPALPDWPFAEDVTLVPDSAWEQSSRVWDP